MNEHKQPDMEDHSRHMEQKKDDHAQHEVLDPSMHMMEDHSTHAGHGTNHSGHEQMFRIRFWWSLLLSIPVLAYSGMLQMWLRFTPPILPFSEWIPLVFSLIV